MSLSPTADLDSLNDQEIMDLALEVIDSWSPRNELIKKADELRSGNWKIPVPKAWKATAREQHSSLPKEISARVVGTITLREPQYDRPAPDDDVLFKERATRVERHLAARFQYDRRNAIPGKNLWTFEADQMVHTGAVCEGSIFAPHAWAGAPIFWDDDQPRRVYWRDENGRDTDEPDKLDLAASSRAYQRDVDRFRTSAKPPITHRPVESKYAFPLFVEDRLLAMIIQRDASLMEVQAGGFTLDLSGGIEKLTGKKSVLEIHTANRCRYYLDKNPLKHEKYGAEGVVTDYGFVPFSYRTGLEGGSLDWGSYGLPLLHLVDQNIRLIDMMLTYRLNAMYQASFTSWYIEYVPRPDGGQTWQVRDKKDGKLLTKYDFESGTIMDFGPERKVQPFLHPGLNADFDKLFQFQVEEVHRIIPRTLQGEATSSGYNTAQSTVQAKAIFGPITDGLELLREEVGIMDLHHINDRVPGPIYLQFEGKGDSPKRGVRLTKVEKADVGGYYGLRVSIDRELDDITRGNFGSNMKAAGIFDDEEAYYMANPTGDYEAHKMRQIRDVVWNSPEIQQALKTKAIQRFGLADAVAEAEAMAQIVPGPDGTPMVKNASGGLSGPGIGSLPSAQGGAGIAGAKTGLPNDGSTSNSAITAVPTANGGPRQRRRGGATRGAPQRQPNRPTPSNAAA